MKYHVDVPFPNRNNNEKIWRTDFRAGVIWTLIAYFLSTTNGGAYNIGLIAQQQANFFCGEVLIVGALFIGFGTIRDLLTPKIEPTPAEREAQEAFAENWLRNNDHRRFPQGGCRIMVVNLAMCRLNAI